MRTKTIYLNITPVFCNNCTRLALAALEDMPLCECCLLTATSDAAKHSDLRVAPLQPSLFPLMEKISSERETVRAA